jgi:hypothetical protein
MAYARSFISSFYDVAVKGKENVAPGIEAHEGVVAATQDAESGKKGFDGGKAGLGVDVDLGAARVGGPPARGNGANFDRLDRFAHLRSMTPVGVEQEKRSAGVGGGERRCTGGEQEMMRKVGFLAQRIVEKVNSGGSAKRLNRASGAVLAAPDDDEDGNGHTGKGKRFSFGCKGFLFRAVRE